MPSELPVLMPLVYDELRRIAARYIRGERPGQTLQATALVNEAFVRLAAERPREFQNRTHFLAIAALSMRQILVQRARARRAVKRGGAPERVTLDDSLAPADPNQGAFGAARDVDLIALDDALMKLSVFDPELVRIVELRYFGGLTVEETAEALAISPATVKRHWCVARAWLKQALSARGSAGRGGSWRRVARVQRWEDVKRLIGEALEHPPKERRAWIARACAGDYELGSQAEALLDAYNSDPDFLEQPALVSPEDLQAFEPPSPAATSSLPPGTLLGGDRYRIVEEVGRGGMGVVYAAEDLLLGRRVAIKLLPENARHDPGRLERFRREALAAARIAHPNVATIHAFERHDGVPFIVSEFVQARTLRQEIESGPLEARRATHLAADIARALVAAHECGVVHRDLKPENVLVTAGDHVKVVDFGVAHLAQEGMPTLTREGAWLGTPAYMAPEQMDGGPVDARADIYACGIVLAEMLTGKHPLRSRSGSAAHAPAGASSPARVLPTGPIEAIVRRCLQLVPDDRYASSADLLEALTGLEKPASVAGDQDGAARWWWEFHQVMTAAIYWLMVPAAWEAWRTLGDQAPARAAALLFVALVAAVVVSANLRLNLWFTSRFMAAHLDRVRAQMGRWIRVGDWVFATALAAGGLGLVLVDKPGRGFLLITVGVGAIVAASLIEPVTARAAFGDEAGPLPPA